MTGAEIMAVVGFALVVFGSLFAVWRYVEAKIEKVRSDAMAASASANTLASTTERELAAHRLHTAETYITKAGMHEATQSIMIAIHAVKEAVDNMTARVDRIVDGRAPRARRGTED